MPERNLELEMDELKNQLSEIKELLIGKKQIVHKTSKKEDDELLPDEEKVVNRGYYEVLSGDDWGDDCPEKQELATIYDKLKNTCGANGETGKVTYLGVFESNNWRFSWIKHGANTDDLLSLIETGNAGKVLNCIGNNDRMNILLTLLKKPMTVAELVKTGKYGSTGQVYHHLKPLIAADFLAEDKDLEKGTYKVQASKVQGIIMFLAGIQDMSNTIPFEEIGYEAADMPAAETDE